MVDCRIGGPFGARCRPGDRLGRAASAARHRRGDGRGDAAHLLLADPQFQPRLLHRDLRHRRPPDRAGRACADPCRRAALGGEVGARFLRRRHPSRRRVPAERSVSWRQPPSRPDRVRADLPGRSAGVLGDQPRAPERHRRLDAWRLQCRSDRDLAGGHPRHAAASVRPRRGAARRAGDAGDERPPSARFPRRSRGDDRLGACRAASACWRWRTSSAGT